jgi:hypothetical protein
MKKIRPYIFPTLIALSALSVSASAGFYSVTGLSKLFVGASFAVIIMAASLEISKLVIASFLYQYWKKTNKLLKIYLSIALVILVGITSAGIYGFLSSAYQQTASQNIVVEKQIAALETKKQRYVDTKISYDKEKEQIAKSTSELRQALSTGTMTQYKDRETGQIINVANSGNRKAFEKQLESTMRQDSLLSVKIDVMNDSIFSLETQILDIQSKAETSGELGPLKYLANLTGYPMDKIINWFILVIILVFDPLAISLVVAANFAFNQLKKPEQLAIYNEKLEPAVESKPEETLKETKEEKSITSSIKEQIDKINAKAVSTWKKNRLISDLLSKNKKK